ncbi:MAG: malonic semialdehyde reductase [Rickettsiales bacterium]|nr:malonic semialdehyde reductase [Rickettsiales bacterium]
MSNALNQDVLDRLFNDGRTYNGWEDKAVSDELLTQLYDLTKMGPTSANMQPLRLIYVKSDGAKAKLMPAIAEGNVDKVKTAPACAILGMDMEFYEHLPELFPHADAKSWFEGNDKLIADSAFRNSSMQGGYFILAARALGLDTGALSGFNNEMVDELFFAGTKIKSNFLCNIGYGLESSLFDRSPRPDFDKFCKII